MTTDALLDWMRGHRPDPHVCPVHGSIVLYSEHGVGMCLRCCWDLRAELTRNPTPGEEVVLA